MKKTRTNTFLLVIAYTSAAFALTCLYSLFLYSQDEMILTQNVVPQYATVLNGTNQYLSKSSPTGLDLNGSELLSNGTFEVDLTGWVSIGNHTGTRITSDFHSGVACVDIVATGAGGYNLNSFKKSPSMNNLPAGKVTMEFWAKSISGSTTLKIDGGSFATQTKIITTSWAKYVVNWNNVTQVASGDFQWYLTGAGEFYLDDVSLTQAYDAMIMASGFSASNTGATQRLVYARSSIGYEIYISSAGRLQGTFSDGLTSVAINSSILRCDDKLFHLGAASFDRAGNATTFLDNANGVTQSITSVGKVTAPNIILGATDSPSTFLNGLLGETQIYIFQSGLPSNIAKIISQINSTWKRNRLPSNINGIRPVFWWKGGIHGGYDESGNGNNLTPVGGAPTIRVRY